MPPLFIGFQRRGGGEIVVEIFEGCFFCSGRGESSVGEDFPAVARHGFLALGRDRLQSVVAAFHGVPGRGRCCGRSRGGSCPGHWASKSGVRFRMGLNRVRMDIWILCSERVGLRCGQVRSSSVPPSFFLRN